MSFCKGITCISRVECMRAGCLYLFQPLEHHVVEFILEVLMLTMGVLVHVLGREYWLLVVFKFYLINHE
jgi:hypothetical protein